MTHNSPRNAVRPLRAVIFDLDGTLVDTLQDIQNAMNHVLVRHGLRSLDLPQYRTLIGEGARLLVAGAVTAAAGAPPHDEARIDVLHAQFLDHYHAHMLEESRPYAGIPELLEHLTSRGVPMAILSNKPDLATREMVQTLFPTVPFRCVHGQRAGGARKPDPSVALDLLAVLGVPASEVALVGDTAIDMQTAHAASLRAIGVAWGFRGAAELHAHGAERVLQSPSQLLDAIAG